MKLILRLIIYSFIVVSFCSCDDENKKYVIDGAIQGGRNFEGETIYLVPFFDAKEQKIDSAIVHNSRFKFEGYASEPQVYILRMRPMMAVFVEELIFVREPGHIRTMISESSEVKGTALNDSIQSWHKFNVETKSVIADLNKQLRIARQRRVDQEQLDSLQYVVDNLLIEFNRRNRATAKANKDNVFGHFLQLYDK
ncbi:MAG: DUF4369 domain-containing protein [Bacteroidales bacterium]|nr:DUF4369 domain-containing protein [Bacteroidales bacterium]